MILDVSPGCEYICGYNNCLCFVLTLYLIPGMVQPEYSCSPSTSIEKSYNRWVSSVKKVIFLPNSVILWGTDILSEFIRGRDISNFLRKGRRGRNWKVRPLQRGEGSSKKREIECYVKVERLLTSTELLISIHLWDHFWNYTLGGNINTK